MTYVDLTNTLILPLDSAQTAVNSDLANQNDRFIEKLPETDIALKMAELSCQQAEQGRKILVIAESAQVLDRILRYVAKHPKIRIFRAGSADSLSDEALAFTQDRIVDTWLGHVAEQCQKDLLVMRQKQDLAESLRLDLERLARKQAALDGEYAAADAELACKRERRLELAKLIEQEQQNYNHLLEHQGGIHTEYAATLRGQPETSQEITEIKQKIDSLQAAKRQTETEIAQNQAVQNQLTTKLAYLSEADSLAEQSDRLEQKMLDRRFELMTLEGEKKKLVKCLERLAAKKPDDYIVLGKTQDEQIMTLWQYQHYLSEFAAVALEVQQQQQAPVNPILSQDIALLQDRVHIIKLRQSDLISIGKTTLNEFYEIVNVLLDTAEEYGWTTSLVKSDMQEVSASFHSFSRLHEATVELLWASPPKMLAKLGFCTDWKKKLFELVVKAKAMEQLIDSPNTIYEHTTAEIESVLLECRYLSQRVYEACYKHLLACGQAVEQAYNKIQADLTDMSNELQRFGNSKTLTAQIVQKAAGEKLSLQQDLEKIETAIYQLQAQLEQLEKELAKEQLALKERQAAQTEADIEYQQALEAAAAQLAEVEQQLTLQVSTLSDSSQQLDRLQAEIEISQAKLEQLACDKKAAAETFTATTAQMEEAMRGFNERKLSLTTDWLNRLNHVSIAEKRSITQLYITNANLMGMTVADADLLSFQQNRFEYDVIITDAADGICVLSSLVPMCEGKQVIVVG